MLMLTSPMLTSVGRTVPLILSPRTIRVAVTPADQSEVSMWSRDPRSTNHSSPGCGRQQAGCPVLAAAGEGEAGGGGGAWGGEGGGEGGGHQQQQQCPGHGAELHLTAASSLQLIMRTVPDNCWCWVLFILGETRGLEKGEHPSAEPHST